MKNLNLYIALLYIVLASIQIVYVGYEQNKVKQQLKEQYELIDATIKTIDVMSNIIDGLAEIQFEASNNDYTKINWDHIDRVINKVIYKN